MILNNFNLSLKKKYSLSFSYWNIEKQITKKIQKLIKNIKKRYQEKCDNIENLLHQVKQCGLILFALHVLEACITQC